MEQTTENLTQYLKMASELESSIYRQENVIKAAKQGLVLDEPAIPIIKAPVDASFNIKPPQKAFDTQASRENYSSQKKSNAGPIIAGILAIVVGIVMIFISSSILAYIVVGIGILLLLGGLIPLVSVSKEQKYMLKHESEHFDEKMKDYEKKRYLAKQQYEEEMKAYKKEKAAADEDYKKRKAKAKQQYDDAVAEVEILEPPLVKTKELLEQLYSNDWIFAKYRNMVAMSMMYEYFASGRCSELTGPDGAYNLYEQELRQNLIINKLDVISSQLEDIKDNQYVLYTEMKKTNQYLNDISETVRDINEGVHVVAANTGEIAKSAKVAAYYAEVTAKNTEALKYIELVTQ